jgi:formylglycine-generating enzyme required for sulfatase activity
MLPDPLPDDPRKWEGWNLYDSNDPYQRLCLTFSPRPSNEKIEEHSRRLLVWWQKKLPLKNQPSNPLAQLLRAGIDAAPRCISEARTELLNPARRAEIDARLAESQRQSGLTEFQKFLDFALSDRVLTAEEEANLLKLGRALSLSSADIHAATAAGLRATGARREADLPPPAPAPAPAPPPPPPPPPPAPILATAAAETPRTRRVRGGANPAEEFRRMLRLSGLDQDSMSDDRRDTFIDMAENLGLNGGDAEDMVDEYLEAIADGTASVNLPPSAGQPATTPRVPAPAAAAMKAKLAAGGRTATPAPGKTTAVAQPVETLSREEELSRYAAFATSVGAQMLFIPSGAFMMGSAAASASVNEQPPTRVTLSRYYLSRHPVTNAEYEQFAPDHKSRRGSWAGPEHPAIYVSSLDAIKFCQWLSAREHKRFRLPSEAEWEYAARGADGRTYPWGETTGAGNLANFADANTTFAWRDPNVNDGFAETSPVGAYPAGASPFGVEDLSGNVWEWCLDYYEAYKGGERANPRGPQHGTQRVYRGGSWKSRFPSLRATARGYNQPAYASNDVGFRIVCECE